MVRGLSGADVMHSFGYECAPATPAPLLTVIDLGHLADDRRDGAMFFGYRRSLQLQSQELSATSTNVDVSTGQGTR